MQNISDFWLIVTFLGITWKKKKKHFDYITLKISKTGSSFYFTIIAIFIEYPAGAFAEEGETGG